MPVASDLVDFRGDYNTRDKMIMEDGSFYKVASRIHYVTGAGIVLKKQGKSAMAMARSQSKKLYTNAVVKRVELALKESCFRRYNAGLTNRVEEFGRLLDLDADCDKTWDGVFECTLPVLVEHEPSLGSIFLTQVNDATVFGGYSALVDHFLPDVLKRRQETITLLETKVQIPLAR